MNLNQLTKRLTGLLLAFDQSSRYKAIQAWIIFFIGLIVYVGVQSALTDVPLWSRSLPPEVDDALTYVLKTKQMEECFTQDCLALEDLRAQLIVKTGGREATEQRNLVVSRVYPVYHPLFSAFSLLLGKFGWDLMTVYKIIWTAAPFFFGLAFICLLTALWGREAGGIAMMLMAFKVFPDTGLHYVVPSNLTMGLAVFIWARIIARGGDAPYTLSVGSLVLLGMHPIGRLYALIASVLTLALAGLKPRLRTWVPVIFTLVIIVFAFYISGKIRRPALGLISVFPSGPSPGFAMIRGALASMEETFINMFRLGPGLFGVLAFFPMAVCLGFVTVSPERRGPALKFLIIYLVFFWGLFIHVSSHPADVILRMWIPMVFHLFGAVGLAIWYCLTKTWDLCADYLKDPVEAPKLDLGRAAPLLVLALLLGYAVNMVFVGMEQIMVTIDHTTQRQPIAIKPSQPELLLSQAEEGDRVLYTSMIIMPYYFIEGAMRLGAVYYHPDLEKTRETDAWLHRPDLKYAVVYNPTVYHPSYEGVDENKWWVTVPEYKYTAYGARRKYHPLSREGRIPASEYQWIQVTPRTGDYPRRLKVLIDNPGRMAKLSMIPLDHNGLALNGEPEVKTVPGRDSSVIEFELPVDPMATSYRLVMPPGQFHVKIKGIVFGDSKLRWPWAQKTDLTFKPKELSTGEITVSFDPERLLPDPLKEKGITILDDQGSTVLLKIDQS